LAARVKNEQIQDFLKMESESGKRELLCAPLRLSVLRCSKKSNIAFTECNEESKAYSDCMSIAKVRPAMRCLHTAVRARVYLNVFRVDCEETAERYVEFFGF
jgi:hypothetical protein